MDELGQEVLDFEDPLDLVHSVKSWEQPMLKLKNGKIFKCEEVLPKKPAGITEPVREPTVLIPKPKPGNTHLNATQFFAPAVPQGMETVKKTDPEPPKVKKRLTLLPQL